MRRSNFTAIVLVSLPLHFSHDFWATRSTYHSFTSGYDPQAKGTAERGVGLIKCLSARALVTPHLDVSYRSYAVRYAAHSLLCNSLLLRQRSSPFGCTVVAQMLNRKDARFPESRAITGRLLFWDRFHDQVSYILCHLTLRTLTLSPIRQPAGLPARLPPKVDIDDLTGRSSLPSTFDRPLQDRNFEDRMILTISTRRRIRRGVAAGTTMTTMKTKTTMSLLSTLSLRLTQFSLRIVHSLFFTYLPKIRPGRMQSTRSSKTMLTRFHSN